MWLIYGIFPIEMQAYLVVSRYWEISCKSSLEWQISDHQKTVKQVIISPWIGMS